MKLKTISTVIGKKFNDWVNTIEDEALQKLVKANTICTGGCIPSMLLHERVNDYDFYFETEETARRVAEYYLKKFQGSASADSWTKSAEVVVIPKEETKDTHNRVMIKVPSDGVLEEDPNDTEDELKSEQDPQFLTNLNLSEDSTKKRDKKGVYDPVFLSSNAITLTNKVQLIIRFWGKAAEIHKNYDFVHVTNYWTSFDGKITTNQRALESILTRELIYVGSKYPVCSLFRLRKYLKRGWNVTAGQILKIAINLQKFDLLNIDVLKEQLIGVDAAYFYRLIEDLKTNNPDADRIDEGYLIELVDKLF